MKVVVKGSVIFFPHRLLCCSNDQHMMVAAHVVPIFAFIERGQGLQNEGGGGRVCELGGVEEVDFTARCVRPGVTR